MELYLINKHEFIRIFYILGFDWGWINELINILVAG